MKGSEMTLPICSSEHEYAFGYLKLVHRKSHLAVNLEILTTSE